MSKGKKKISESLKSYHLILLSCLLCIIFLLNSKNVNKKRTKSNEYYKRRWRENVGWTLLEENCPLESCHCPLLKSLDGNKYCVKCEMRQFPHKLRSRQRYTDLVLKAHQELAIRETGLMKINNKLNFNVFGKESLLNSLKTKLAYLSIYVWKILT